MRERDKADREQLLHPEENHSEMHRLAEEAMEEKNMHAVADPDTGVCLLTSEPAMVFIKQAFCSLSSI